MNQLRNIERHLRDKKEECAFMWDNVEERKKHHLDLLNSRLSFDMTNANAQVNNDDELSVPLPDEFKVDKQCGNFVGDTNHTEFDFVKWNFLFKTL